MAKKTSEKTNTNALETKPKKGVAKKPAAATTTVNDQLGARQLKQPKYKAFRLQKRIKHPNPKLPNSFRLFGCATKVLTRNWKFFLGIILIYAILNMVFVTGFSAGSSITGVKQSIDQLTQAHGPNLTNAAALFTYMIGNSSTTSSSAGSYQIILLIMASLALVWGLRQAYANHHPRVRDAYYLGMYPIVPVLLVLFVVGLQIVPILVGAALYNAAVAGGAAVFTIEKVLWALLFFFLTVLSLYMLCSSLFALYISTLQDMTPVKALRSARQLVLHRRWSVMRKIVFLPVALLVIAIAIMLPSILFLTAAAPWIFFVISIFVLAIVHSYMYTLYRELL